MIFIVIFPGVQQRKLPGEQILTSVLSGRTQPLLGTAHVREYFASSREHRPTSSVGLPRQRLYPVNTSASGSIPHRLREYRKHTGWPFPIPETVRSRRFGPGVHGDGQQQERNDERTEATRVRSQL